MNKIRSWARALRASLTAPPPNLIDFSLLFFATLMLLRADIAGLLFMVFVGITRVGIMVSGPRIQNVHIHNLTSAPAPREPSKNDL